MNNPVSIKLLLYSHLILADKNLPSEQKLFLQRAIPYLRSKPSPKLDFWTETVDQRTRLLFSREAALCLSSPKPYLCRYSFSTYPYLSDQTVFIPAIRTETQRQSYIYMDFS